MRRFAIFPILTLTIALAACGGGSSTSPTPVGAPSSGGVTPPAGTTTWRVTYRQATAFTCPAATPDSGSATMLVDPSGNTLVLTDQGTSLGGGTTPTLVFSRDGSGKYVWTDPTGVASISFGFVSQTHAEGNASRIASSGNPCSATWPILLDR